MRAGDVNRVQARTQDALAQIVANEPMRDGRDANEVASWLSHVLDVSRQRVADVLGVDRRTFTRWVSQSATRPADVDARRLRTFARTVNLLHGGGRRPLVRAAQP